MKGRSQSSSTRKKRSKKRARAANGRAEGSRHEWSVAEILHRLRESADPRNVEGMARFGIRAETVYGVSKPQLDEFARAIGTNHNLAQLLWNSSAHDARLLGMLIADADQVTAELMEEWVRAFDNWDVCDGTCCHLFVFAKDAWEKALEWTEREREFEKRAGFALAAYLAIHDKTARDEQFLQVLPLIEKQAWDERNFVRKAVNWALRNIGKRNLRLNRAAIAAARRIQKQDSRTARWIAADALRELQSEAVQARLRKKMRTS